LTSAKPNRNFRIVGTLFAVLLLAAGCSRDVGPNGYTAAVQSNYMENCAAGTNTKLSSTNAMLYCQCTYTAFVDNVAFDRFRAFEDYLREHVGDDINSRTDLERNPNYGDIVKLLDGCLDQGPSAPTTTTSPTTIAR